MSEHERENLEKPLCAGPAGNPSAPSWRVPAGAWDTHFHVLGPAHRFPFDQGRKYTPPDAPFERCLDMHKTLGIDRGFVVHANVHGFDNSVDLDAITESGGRYLGVVRLGEQTTAQQCRALHAQGVRGVRFAFNPAHGGTLDRGTFDHVLSCVADLGWFVDLHFEGEALPGLMSWIEAIPAEVVIDHFGRVDPSQGLDHAPIRSLLALAERPNIWIKLTGADRISRAGVPYRDVIPLAHRLVGIAADRLLWGSDWPHTGYFDASQVPDAGVLLDALAAMIPDAEMRNKVLVDNPLNLLARCGGDQQPPA